MTRGTLVNVHLPTTDAHAFFLRHREKGLADVVLDNGGILTVKEADLDPPEEHGSMAIVSMVIAGVWSFLVGLGVGWWIGS